MRRLTIIATLCLALAASGWALQGWEVEGEVLNRDGAGVAYCRVEFFVGAQETPRYSVTTNADGFFYLTDPDYGEYSVVVSKYDRQQLFEPVYIDEEGLDPPYFEVSW